MSKRTILEESRIEPGVTYSGMGTSAKRTGLIMPPTSDMVLFFSDDPTPWPSHHLQLL